MRILSRYAIRAHIGPFIFAFSAVTGLLFLNAIAQRLGDLVGKGLETTVILEFMLYSLPHIVALTFPMAVLVAVLYVFSDMTGNNEVMALAAGGVHPGRLLAPLLLVGAVLTGTMLYFNDRVLPESNHQLSRLLSDVGSQSPTFDLREEVINEVHTVDDSRRFLRARSIDAATNRMLDVEIYDLTRAGETRTIIAQRGEMAFTPDGRDLYMTLEDGFVLETAENRPAAFQRLYFERQVIPFRGVGAELERRTGGGSRSDREMTIAMLRERVSESFHNIHGVADDMKAISMRALEAALGTTAVAAADGFEEGQRVNGFITDPVLSEVTQEARVNQTRWDVQRLTVYRYRVEIYKKHAIAFACLVFIFLGVPLAIRYPQGGVGMVIALSLTIFFLYWVGLIVGERMADRGHIHPWIAMWSPNIVLMIPALILTLRMGHDMSTNRGSRWDEIRFRVAELVRKLTSRGRRSSANDPLVAGDVR